jgi:hypothetical protein
LFALVVLAVSTVVHASTFLGVDPLAKFPWLMWIHVAIFPPFIAAIYYARSLGGAEQNRADQVIRGAPTWLRTLTGIFFAYMFVNFAVFTVLSEGGNPDQRDGKYLLKSHGRVLRELTEDEYHAHQAHLVRGFSGHWMFFSCCALAMLLGARRNRRCTAEPSSALTAPASRNDAGIDQVQSEPSPPESIAANIVPTPATVGLGLSSLAVYVACVAMILSGLPALSMAAVVPSATAMVLAVRRRHGFPHRSFESVLGGLTVFPNALLAARMGRMVAEFVYVAFYVGMGAALRHGVSVTFPREGPAQLSNGALLHNRVWSALMFFVLFPLFGVGTIGLTYLAEQFGCLLQGARRVKI